MRKITETIVDAFMERSKRTIGNSHTDGQTLSLHGNAIAWHGEHNGAAGVFMTLAGWPTSTTRERLQGVLSRMGHRSPHLAPDRPCLNIHQQRKQQRISAHSLDNSADGFDTIEADTVFFVAFPATAKGMDAVRIL